MYVTGPTGTPVSSATSRRTASSRLSQTPTNPARVEYDPGAEPLCRASRHLPWFSTSMITAGSTRGKCRRARLVPARPEVAAVADAGRGPATAAVALMAMPVQDPARVSQQGSLGRAERPDQGPHVQDPLPAGRRGGRGFPGLRQVGREDRAVVVEAEEHHLGR